MSGILDRAYARSKRGLAHENVDWHPIVQDNPLPPIWYCFVPKIVVRDKGLREGILPKEGKVVTYVISSLNLVASDAEQFMCNLRQIYDDAMEKINEDLKQWRDINLLGISLGNVLSCKIANSLPNKKVKNLVSLVGGGRLGSSTWNSIMTSHIAKSSGCKSVQEYEGLVQEFSPLNNLEGVNAQRLFARFGSSDLLIPYNPDGKELRNSLENLKVNEKDIKTYPFADHCSALFFSSKAGIHDKVK